MHRRCCCILNHCLLRLRIFRIRLLLFCCLRRGWGWDNFIAEVDQGVGMKFPRWLRGYVTYVLPCLIIFVFVMGYVDKFWK